MLRLLTALSVVIVTASLLIPLFAEAPIPVKEVAPLTDLVFEVNARIAELEESLATEETYEDLKEDDIRRAFGVLACLAQAIAEHGDAEQTEIAGPALRDAALSFSLKSSFVQAQGALQGLKSAQSGAATDAPVEHDWAKLINMHPMMEEIEVRSGKLVRVTRRPRGKPEETAHTSTIAVLTLAMMADTHEVKDKADIPQWQEMSAEYQQLMTQLSTAIREKDRGTAGKLLQQATESCDRCHEKFRD